MTAGAAPRAAAAGRRLAPAAVLVVVGCAASGPDAVEPSASAAPAPSAPGSDAKGDGDARGTANTDAKADPTTDAEWDRELPAGWQLYDFVDDDEDAAEERAADEATTGAPPARPFAVLPLRVVDDVTGEPVAGARIDNWWEADTAHAEPWEDLRQGSWTTDQDGRALVAAADRAPWYYVDAPGWAPWAQMGLEEEIRLVRGADFAFEVQDWLGRPAPGAVVDYVLGCGHTPNARCENAGADGRFVLRCVNPRRGDLWIRHAGIAGRNEAYSGFQDLPEVDGVRILHGDPGPVLEGVVLRADGSPAAGGAIVGSREAHRGPWTVAGPDGRYRLVGALPHDELIAMAPATDAVPEGLQAPQVEFLSVPGVFATVRLPATGERWPTNEEREARRAQRRAERDLFERGAEPEPVVPPEGPGVRVRVTASSGKVATGRVTILLVRDEDGRALRSVPMCRDGAAVHAIAAPPGGWTVTVGDAAGLLRPASQRVEVTSGWTDVAFTLEPNPVWKPSIVERAPDGTETEVDPVDAGRFRVVCADGVTETTPRREDVRSASGAGFADGSIFVPAAGPFAVEFRTEGRVARVLLDRPPQGDGPALVLPPRDPEEPEIDDSERLRQFPSARLQVLLPDGRPAAGLRVTLGAAGPPVAGGVRRRETWDVTLDEDGAASASLDRGSTVEAELRGDDAEGVLPLRSRIDGPGPWTIRWPTGVVEVRAADETGESLPEFAVCLNGWDTLDPVDGVVRLRGVGAGPLRLWVGAPGRRMRDVRVVPAAGESRAVTVRMRPSAAE